MPFVSITRLRVRSWSYVPAFVVQTLRIARQAARADGNLAVRAKPGYGPPELRRMAATFNMMAGRLEALVHGHRAMLADASHQLRTPLTALRLRLDLLLHASILVHILAVPLSSIFPSFRGRKPLGSRSGSLIRLGREERILSKEVLHAQLGDGGVHFTLHLLKGAARAGDPAAPCTATKAGDPLAGFGRYLAACGR